MPSVVSFEFARCRFSTVSLASIFKSKVDERRFLTFAITGVDMEPPEWD
jgi:hypothetical protein